MADLDVQPKKRGSSWVWILLLLIIAVAVYFFVRNRDEMDTGINNGNTTDTINRVDTNSP